MNAKIKFYFLPLFLIAAYFLPNFALADTLGDSRVFNVDSYYDVSGRTKITANLKYVSDRAYFYVEADYFNSLAAAEQADFQNKLAALTSSFDQAIYPKLTSVFGSEPNPGVDNDSKMTVLVEKMFQTAGGYFLNVNGYPKSGAADSNEREMVYVNAVHLAAGDNTKAFLAHEFQHLISFNQKEKIRGVSEEVWMNELRSEVAPTISGFDEPYAGSNLESRSIKFFNNPYDSLIDWSQSVDDYASVNIFGQYLLGRFGETIFSKMTQSAKTGIESVDEALASLGKTEKFDDVFADFSAANFLNDCSATPAAGRAASVYCYANQNLKSLILSPKTTLALGAGQSTALQDQVIYWSNRGYKFNYSGPADKKTLVLKFASEANANFYVPYVVKDWTGKNSVGVFPVNQGNGEISVPDFGGGNSSVLIMPFSRRRNGLPQNSSAAPNFTVTASVVEIQNPSISSISRITDLTFGGAEMAISGANFQNGAKVYFGDNETAARFVNSGRLEVSVPAASSAGEVNISVKNPDGGSVVFGQPFRYVSARQEGSLIRAKGTSAVYIVKGKYRRHISDAKIFGMYGHLGFADVAEISGDELNLYQESRLIRLDGDLKVYEIGPDKTKKWLNITAEEFLSRGYSFDSVYFVNEKEFNFYPHT